MAETMKIPGCPIVFVVDYDLPPGVINPVKDAPARCGPYAKTFDKRITPP